MRVIEANIVEHNNWKIIENEIKKLDFDGLFVSFCELHFKNTSTPVQEPWYGVLHNPHDWEKYSPYNDKSIFEQSSFLESLKNCKLLFVMSKTLIEPVRIKLNSMNYNTNVINLYHPINNLKFSFNFDKYKNNPNKTVYSIGNWLRKQYTIFKLKCDDSKFTKAIVPFTSRTKCELEYYVNFDKINLTDSEINSVIKYAKLDDFNYQKIFENNLVFLDVYLTTINNTFLECLSSNTPILLNRHQEYIDILGGDYPLFYDSLDDINSFIYDDQNILNAHNHLKKIDKKFFTMKYFIRDISSKIHLLSS